MKMQKNPTIENMIDEIEVKETTKGFTPAQNNDCESDEANAVELMKQGSKEIDGADFHPVKILRRNYQIIFILKNH